MLSFLTLIVGDPGRSRHFYEAVLQAPVKYEGEGLVFLDLGGTTLALITAEALQRETGLPQAGAPGPVLLSWNVAEKPMVEEILGRVEPAGGTILQTAGATRWGAFAAFFADPDGHRWELAWNPRGAGLRD